MRENIDRPTQAPSGSDWLNYSYFVFFLLIVYSPLDLIKKNENSEWKRQRGVRGCLYCSIPNSLCISFFFPFGSGLSQVFSSPLPRFILSLSLLSTPLCCIYYPTLPLTLLSPSFPPSSARSQRSADSVRSRRWSGVAARLCLAAHLISSSPIWYPWVFFSFSSSSGHLLPCVRDQWLRIAFNF